MTDWISRATPGVQALKPYLPGKPIEELEREYGVSDIVKLASNENPLGPSPKAQAAIAQLGDLALYPDPNGFSLKAKLAALHQVDPAQVTLGNGSNDVLVLLAEVFLNKNSNAVFSQYAFAVYPIATQATGAAAKVVPALPVDHPAMPLGHDLDAIRTAIDADTRIVFIANPNNPTGTWVEEPALRQFVAAVPDDVVVVIDEAYFEYAAEGLPNASEWINDFDNLVVTRTFSKAYGLAGLRVGYALSNSAIADLLNRVRQPFNVSTPALAAAEAALDDIEYIERSQQLNTAGMAQLKTAFQRMGLPVVPSAANFLLVDTGRDSLQVYDQLLRAGVIVRPVVNYGLTQHLRITIGTEAQNNQLIEALESILSD